MGVESVSKKRKTHDAADADLISDLPRGIIDDIMERLPLHDAAKMCILSHKWHHIWTSTSRLNFDAPFFSSVFSKTKLNVDKFSHIVSKILLQHDGPILKFFLYIPALKFCPDVTQWVKFISRNGVKDFGLVNQYYSPLKLSSCLFSCAWLERLKLHHCIFSPPPSFKGFKQLVSLELQNVIFEEGTFEDLLVSCMVLEKLKVTNCTGIKHVKVDSPNLKHLIVDGTLNSLFVRNAENLVSAVIALKGLAKFDHKTSLCDLIEVLANSCKLENLCFGGDFVKVLCEERLVPTKFGKLRGLELLSIRLDWVNDFSSAVRIIQSCPNIKKLNISVSMSNHRNAQVLDYNHEFVLHHLRCAKISIYGATHTELKLIEFLLACSPALEILSVTYVRRIRKRFRSSMLMQLLNFCRASRKVKIICPNPIISVDSSDSSSFASRSSASDSSDSDSSTSFSDFD